MAIMNKLMSTFTRPCQVAITVWSHLWTPHKTTWILRNAIGHTSSNVSVFLYPTSHDPFSDFFFYQSQQHSSYTYHKTWSILMVQEFPKIRTNINISLIYTCYGIKYYNIYRFSSFSYLYCWTIVVVFIHMNRDINLSFTLE